MPGRRRDNGYLPRNPPPRCVEANDRCPPTSDLREPLGAPRRRSRMVEAAGPDRASRTVAGGALPWSRSGSAASPIARLDRGSPAPTAAARPCRSEPSLALRSPGRNRGPGRRRGSPAVAAADPAVVEGRGRCLAVAGRGRGCPAPPSVAGGALPRNGFGRGDRGSAGRHSHMLGGKAGQGPDRCSQLS